MKEDILALFELQGLERVLEGFEVGDKDVAHAFVLAIDSPRARGLYNIASGVRRVNSSNQVTEVRIVHSPKR